LFRSNGTRYAGCFTPPRETVASHGTQLIDTLSPSSLTPERETGQVLRVPGHHSLAPHFLNHQRPGGHSPGRCYLVTRGARRRNPPSLTVGPRISLHPFRQRASL